VRVQALDGTGRSLDFELDGFAAVVAQHECDHLDGVVYVDRVEPETLAFDEELRKHGLPQVGAFEEETESLEEA
jgi:peptide deformylase